jgi:hypothetical protein
MLEPHCSHFTRNTDLHYLNNTVPTDVQNMIFPVAWNMITYQLKIFTDITRSLLPESAGFMQMKEGP